MNQLDNCNRNQTFIKRHSVIQRCSLPKSVTNKTETNKNELTEQIIQNNCYLPPEHHCLQTPKTWHPLNQHPKQLSDNSTTQLPIIQPMIIDGQVTKNCAL